MQERGWKTEFGKKSELSKIYGMKKSVREGSFNFQGWPKSHVVSILWGTGGKLLTAMGHDNLCVPSQRLTPAAWMRKRCH
jgi:hypothetical protein